MSVWTKPYKFNTWLEVHDAAKIYRDAFKNIRTLPEQDGIRHSCHAAVSRKAHSAWRKYMDDYNGSSGDAG